VVHNDDFVPAEGKFGPPRASSGLVRAERLPIKQMVSSFGQIKQSFGDASWPRFLWVMSVATDGM